MDNFNILLSLAFFQGISSSFHCITMCGPLLASVRSDKSKWISNGIYQIGRLMGYGAMGMLLGSTGSGVDSIGEFSNIQWLSGILSALILIYTGLKMIFSEGSTGNLYLIQKVLRPLYGKFGNREAYPNLSPFTFGTLSALLPCGVLLPVYTLSFSSGNPFGGAIIMFGFFLGTFPALFLAGEGISILKRNMNPKKLFFLGMILIFLGLGTVFVRVSHADNPATCHTPSHKFK